MISTDPVDLTHDLAELTRAMGHDADLEELLRRGLDWLARLAPYDLACVFALREDELVVRAAQGRLADARVRAHRLALRDYPSVREALETRRARAFTDHDHTHDGDPFDGVLDLSPGHSCMVVPLAAGERVLGVLTLDRSECVPYPAATVDLVEIYARILALALRLADQSATLARLTEQTREHARLLEERVGGRAEHEVWTQSASPGVRDVALRAQQVAQATTPVLILGETGTGKERLAHAIHRWSPRRDRPFVVVNCAAIPAGTVESELFGHDKGAFTGASRERHGRFRTANGGTLFLDELGELPAEIQAKLLRVLQSGELQPLGSDRTMKVDVRLLAATHIDLLAAVEQGKFREDLYYRLAVFPLRLPPLRERIEDLPSLVRSLLDESSSRTGRRGLEIQEDALQVLAKHPWPGNVRELANVLERAAILCRDGVVRPADLGLGASETSRARARSGGAPLLTLAEHERRYLREVLEHTGGRIYGDGGAAQILDLRPTTLQSRLKKLGVARRKP